MSKDELPQREAGATLPVDEWAQLIVNRESRRLEDANREGDR